MSPFSIEIHPISNGFVCKVGCQLVAFTSQTDLIKSLEEYLKDPRKFIGAYEQDASKCLEPCRPSPEVSTRSEASWATRLPSGGRLAALLRR